MNVTLTTRIASVRFSLQAVIEDHHGVDTIKEVKVYCIDKHKDLSGFMSDNAMLLFRQEIGKFADVDDLTYEQ